MTMRNFFAALLALAQASIILFLSHYGYQWVAAAVVLLPYTWMWVKAKRSWGRWLAFAPGIIIGLSVAFIIGLDSKPQGISVFPPLTQVLLSILYAGWLWWLPRATDAVSRMVVMSVSQTLAIATIFLIAAFWHWPAAFIVLLTWAVSFVIAWQYLAEREESAAIILASTWALVASEVAWVLSLWLVNYRIGDRYVIIPQASLIILGLGYTYLHIYLAHANKHLSRRRLLEYVTIAGVLLAIVIAGTRWTGIL